MQSRLFKGTSTIATRVPSLVVIGNFDGVHRGHQTVIRTALDHARSRGLRPVALTFDPHPAEVLGRGSIPILTTLDRKVLLLLRSSERLVVAVEPFTFELSRWSPEEFVGSILVERLDARVVMVGENFRFGKDRSGDLGTLKRLGAAEGFDVRVEPLVGDSEGVFSSTRAREAIRKGELEKAERCLGRPHAFSGRVVRGQARGRTLGVPTANLTDIREILPSEGVYACLVDRADPEGGGVQLARGVLNIGVRPTLSAGYSVEAHLMDFEDDLYDSFLRVHLVQRLREERRFGDLSELKRQIHSDILEARRILAERSPDPAAEGAWA